MEAKVDRPGAFQLGGVNLVSYASFDGDGTPKRLDIRNLIVEFNIYEDLNSPFLSGDMTLIDAINDTIVFPLPTSPCNNLNILLFDLRSLFIWLIAFNWSLVSLKSIFFIIFW